MDALRKPLVCRDIAESVARVLQAGNQGTRRKRQSATHSFCGRKSSPTFHM
jgi:hypothetical protein